MILCLLSSFAYVDFPFTHLVWLLRCSSLLRQRQGPRGEDREASGQVHSLVCGTGGVWVNFVMGFHHSNSILDLVTCAMYDVSPLDTFSLLSLAHLEPYLAVSSYTRPPCRVSPSCTSSSSTWRPCTTLTAWGCTSSRIWSSPHGQRESSSS